MMLDRSWLEIAPERRCAWPRLPPGGTRREFDTGGSDPSPLVGLELINTGPLVVPSPPIYSLSFLRWPPVRSGMGRLLAGECVDGPLLVEVQSPVDAGNSKRGGALIEICCGGRVRVALRRMLRLSVLQREPYRDGVWCSGRTLVRRKGKTNAGSGSGVILAIFREGNTSDPIVLSSCGAMVAKEGRGDEI